MKLMILGLLLSAGAAQAEIGGQIMINGSETEAKILIQETQEDGELSKLFDQMKIDATGSKSSPKKKFRLSNGRFSFECAKVISPEAPPATSCTFVIKAESRSGDISVFIRDSFDGKVATIGMTQVFAQELEGIFPADESGQVDYLLRAGSSLVLQTKGASWGHLSIGFSGK